MITAVITQAAPSEAKMNEVLTPHIEVKVSGQEPDANLCAMAAVMDPDSHEVVGNLVKEPTATSGDLEEDGSIVFTFSKSRIIAAGTYEVRLDIYDVNKGALLLKSVGAGKISVTN